MSRPAFYKLWNAIKDHDVFKSNKKKKQVDSKYQLLVLLKYLGTEGDGMSDSKAISIFPSSTGHFDLMKERVITAILENCSHVYCWPNATERLEIASFIENKHYINQCVGIGDGTLLPLAFKPSRDDFTDFYGRKGGYTLTMFIISDHLNRIRYYHAGWPGAVHDERVFRNTRVCLQPHNYFSSKQYILCDSAVTARDFVVPQYKKVIGDVSLPPDKMQFNTICAKPRVAVEHTIGCLKGRFPMLRNIRVRITDNKESIHKIQRYIRLCVVLHNLMIGFNEE